MDENLRTLEGLKQMQSAPLSVKVRMTMSRICDWVYEYGEDGVCCSFSGGKDSTVLLDLVRNKCGFKNVPAVFVDVPTQYPELKAFVKTFDNVVILHPTMGFYEVCKRYGFPIVSKEISDSVYGARKFLKKVRDGIDAETTRGGAARNRLSRFCGYNGNTETARGEERQGISGLTEGDYP